MDKKVVFCISKGIVFFFHAESINSYKKLKIFKDVPTTLRFQKGSLLKRL